jgi:hypothetical protein
MKALARQRCVGFKGIDQQIEDQKTERRAQERREKKRRSEAVKLETQACMERVRPFLYFLQTFYAGLRHKAQRVGVTMEYVAVMFLELEREDAWQAFSQVVSTLILPMGSIRKRSHQMYYLERIMETWTEVGEYDGDLDPFIQFIRFGMQQQTLKELVVSLVSSENAVQARQVVRQLSALDFETAHARILPDEVKQQVQFCKQVVMKDTQTYAFPGNSSATVSRGKSSNEDEEEVEI